MPLQIKYRRLGILPPVAVTWFNDNMSVEPAKGVYLHSFLQSKPVEKFISAKCISEQDFKTVVLNLFLDEDKLLEKMDPKSCRYEIRKIQKLVDDGHAIDIRHNTDFGRFLNVANGYIREKKYTKLLSFRNLKLYLKKDAGELFTFYYDNQLIGGNFYVKSYPERVRLLYSFNDRFQNDELMKMTGALMRFFHWKLIKLYKEKGYKLYDFGGVVLDKDSPTYGIAKFKLSFGGEVLDEKNYILVRENLLGKIYLFLK
jgi:lipid II:glycine glycyltransferase (peptidoglycan interpeptide bridge formation enzyme)